MSSDDGGFEGSDEWRTGRKGERMVEEFVQKRGWRTLPAHKYTGEGAPTLQRNHEHIVLPDLLAVRDGDSRFVEVKTKNNISNYRKIEKFQHGIEYDHWKAYCETQNETGLDVWLFLYETITGSLLRAKINDLEIHHLLLEDEPGYDAYGSEMVFWNREHFEMVNPYVDGAKYLFGQQKLESYFDCSIDTDAFGEGEDEISTQTSLEAFEEGWV